MYDLTACMVTYNTDEEVLGKIINCFQKLKLNFKLFISDNSEKNGLEEFIKKFSDDRIEYIFNNSNNGFGAGHNIVIEKFLDTRRRGMWGPIERDIIPSLLVNGCVTRDTTVPGELAFPQKCGRIIRKR